MWVRDAPGDMTGMRLLRHRRSTAVSRTDAVADAARLISSSCGDWQGRF